MKRKLIFLALVCAVVLGNHTGRAGDGFYIIPVPAGLGTKIKSVPYTINSPGFY